jgi:hypothetical protein
MTHGIDAIGQMVSSSRLQIWGPISVERCGRVKDAHLLTKSIQFFVLVHMLSSLIIETDAIADRGGAEQWIRAASTDPLPEMRFGRYRVPVVADQMD